MIKRPIQIILTLTISFLISVSVYGQILPDSIQIIKTTYVNGFQEDEKVYASEKQSIIRERKSFFLNSNEINKYVIINLLDEISKPNNTFNLLTKYGIDTIWVKNNPQSLLDLYSKQNKIEWNMEQKEFIFKELTNIENYNKELIAYFSNGCCYTMHRSYRYQTILRIYHGGKLTNELTSRKHVWGYKMPWINEMGDELYNYNIEKIINKFDTRYYKTIKPLFNKKLLKTIVNEIIDYNVQNLYKLSAYSYLKEIEELKLNFKILSFEEVYARGRYIWDEPKTMKITLKSSEMLPNVYLQFLATKTGNTIYSRDSVISDYKTIINRIQSVKFIIDYLKKDTSSRLDIYYFNNKGINEYNIDGINKNKKEWIRHDAFLNSIKRYDTLEVKPSFASNESVKISERLYCGCNYRFEKSYLEKAIFFELINGESDNSVWFLMPDNVVLLYIMEGKKLLNFDFTSFGNKYTGVQFPCVIFNFNGDIIEK